MMFFVLYDEFDIIVGYYYCFDKCVFCIFCRVRWVNFVFLKVLLLYGDFFCDCLIGWFGVEGKGGLGSLLSFYIFFVLIW